MNDKELLELAAKAAGMTDKHYNNGESNAYYAGSLFYMTGPGHSHSPWNPLTDDGDAFRLAVKLGMELTLPVKRQEVSGASLWFKGALIHKMKWLDEDAEDSYFMDYARRNICEVAAEVGKAMP